MSTTSLVVIIISLIAILIALFLFQLRSKSLQSLKDLEEKKAKALNQHINEHLNRVKELKLTGETEKLFEKWRKEWDDITTSAIPGVDEGIQLTEHYINKYNFAKVKNQVHITEIMIETVSERMSKILQEIDKLMTTRAESTKLRETATEEYRDLWKNLLAHRHAYTLCEEKLEEKLDQTKEQLTTLEQAEAGGNYVSAKEIGGEVTASLAEIKATMEEIPGLLLECQTHLPKQISSVSEGSLQMEEQGYLLEHLQVATELASLSIRLDEATEQLRNLQVTKAKESLAFINQRMDVLCEQLEEEVKARQLFERSLQTVGKNLAQFEAEVIAMKEETKLVQQSYELQEEDIAVQQQIEDQLSQLQKKYESLQTQVVDRDVAFSVMMNDLQNIGEQLTHMNRQYQEYVEKIRDLRKDELAVYDALEKQKYALQDAERKLRKANLPAGVPNFYHEQLERGQTSLEMTYKELEKKPLDILIADKLLAQTIQHVEIATTEVNNLLEQATVAEFLIQYGNRYRSRNPKNHLLLQEAESYFRKSDYESAIEQVSVLLETYEPGITEALTKKLTEEEKS